ncbi:YfhO family protein [Flavobacterium sp. Fl-77]|uniref:YfhO family protein n=1 Tax=Flavobacterium flavipigmentatum TaxID=2893884 RepID=A0AAJ2SFN2_9FLAO|nr:MULTISPECIES: YfhO family protein [unclassified Flavobacterium]MDX6181753.1 YfhO family protein [Flavobacterium sp. Fl-33]MDX6185213.1 YfhO family protein [Flavobacterium sp. Fl-77]UFH37320.1 YfhO family protein [Flavobacterium sp. F-70]
MKIVNKFYPHALVILGFILVSLIYFYPVLQGKQIFQSDIAQYTGMAKEQNDFRATEHAEPFWTNSAFGGMPTYQLGANYPNDFVGKLDDLLRFLPRPADYLFLYFLGFYGLLLVLKTDPLKAFIGALAFGFSTYLIIILGVGHNAKAHAIAYMPLVIAGFLLVFRKKYIWGGLLTMFAVALEVNANHFQMTYYLLIFLLILSGYFAFNFIKQKEYKPLLITIGTLAIAGIFAIGANATNLLATSEYAKFSIRDKSELTFNPDGSKNLTTAAMTTDYITEYSYGIAESFNLIAPRLFGGSSNENVGTDSRMYSFMLEQGVPASQAEEFVSGMPTYWGDQPIVSAPAYIGVVVFFLAILALFIDERKIKYVFLAGALFTLMLSWGKNFPALTDFFIEYVPMYDKFRAVSSIQVILELCFPVLAVMGLQSFFKSKDEPKLQQKALVQTGVFGLGVLLILVFAKSMFHFTGMNDNGYMQAYGPAFVDTLKEDRMSLYSADLLRSGFFIVVTFGILWLCIKNKLAQNTTLIIVGILMIFDLFFVDKKYVSAKDFVSPVQIAAPFQQTPVDTEILNDKSIYRVFDIQGQLQGRSSYFHKTIGGYSAVRPRRMQQLIDYQIMKNNFEVLNMLNVKYVIQVNKEGKEFPTINPDANGNAWFVSTVKLVNKPDDVMKALNTIDTKKVAVFNVREHEGKFRSARLKKQWDTTGTVKVIEYKPNYIKYESSNGKDGLAVFSEMYYKNGWNAYVDGKLTDHFPVDYVLRAMEVPGGKHTIEFKFEPQVIKIGSTIALVSSIGMLLLLVGGIYFEKFYRKNSQRIHGDTQKNI